MKVEKYKSGVRIYMLAGEKALNDYTQMYNQINSISTLLSLKLNEVYTGVLHQVQEIEKLKKEKSQLKNVLIENEISNFEKQKNIIIEKENMEMNDVKNYCTKLKEKASNISGVVSNGKFILMSDTINLKDVFDELKQNINVKGGGNKLLVQGQLLDDIDKFKEIINKF